MARAPKDPRVTDLRSYRRERARASRAPPPRPAASEPMLGGRRYAGLILVLAIVVLAAMALLGR